MRTRTSILLTAALAVLLLAGGCKKHSPWRPAEGTPVRFAVMSQSPSTKSAYSGEIITGGSSKYERIDWVENDKLAIFMAWGSEGLEEPEDYIITDYSVGTITADGRKSVAMVDPVEEPLVWGDADKMYTFAALYPSPSVDEEWGNEIDLYNLTLTYPAVQTLTPKGESGADALTLLPDMKYAYMFCFPIDPVASTSDPVTLSLMPVFNAYEISISAGDNDEINLTQFRLVSNRDDEPLACVRNLYTDESRDESTSITVDLTGIKLVRNGDPLVLTVFSYADSYEELYLEFTGAEIGTRKLELKRDGAWIHFDALVKHRITGLYFPALDEGTAGGQGINWNGTEGEDLNWNGAEGEDINWGGNKPYVLPGDFSISATKKVNFSRGNLVYKAGEWDFHKNQWDRCFSENGVTLTFDENSTFDLFGWATAGIAAADATMVNYQPWSYNDQQIVGQESINPYGYGPSINTLPGLTDWGVYAEYCDWGYNYKLRQKLGNGWFTMSADEWEYMFQDRPASTLNGVENARFAKAKVHGRPGLIIFSDDFATNYAGDQSIFVVGSINQRDKYGSTYSDIILSDSVWKNVEAAGAVFLGPTGCIFEDRMFFANEGDLFANFYWSSTSEGIHLEHGEYYSMVSVFGCEGEELITSEDGTLPRFYGCAVRLVKLAE